MSPSTAPAPVASGAAAAPVAARPARGTRAARSRIRQAAGYVAVLVWGLPLAAFVAAAVHADASPCVAAADMPCNDQGVLVLTAVLAATLLIPLGLLALVLVAVLATALPSRPPAVLALVASASVVALAAVVWAIISFATS